MKRRAPPCFSVNVDNFETSSLESSIVSKFSLIRDGVTDLGRTTTPRATTHVSMSKCVCGWLYLARKSIFDLYLLLVYLPWP